MLIDSHSPALTLLCNSAEVSKSMFTCNCRVAAFSVCVFVYFATMAPCLVSPSFLGLMSVGGPGKSPVEGAEATGMELIHERV